MSQKQLSVCSERVCRTRLGAACRWWDVVLLAALMAVINGPLFTGGKTDLWAFYPGAVAKGQWWRLITNDFAHNSIPHLLVVGSMFWVLYLTLEEDRPLRRLAYVFLSGAGSNMAATLFEPAASIAGMRGLSGIVHGLLGVWALERILAPGDSPDWRVLGGAVLLLTVGKLVLEHASGWSLYASLHLDSAGPPGVPCHAAGLLAGVLAFACFHASASLRSH